jgi:hypothetical protein
MPNRIRQAGQGHASSDDPESSPHRPFALRVVTTEACDGAESPTCSRMVFSVDGPGEWEQRIWTDAQWAALSRADHPPHDEVYHLDGGCYCHFRKVAGRN